MATQHQQSAAVQGVLIGAMAVWGLNVTAVKLLTASFEPTMIGALRMIVACAALTVIVLWKRCGMPVLTWRQFVAVIVCAVLMVYANQILFAEGLQRSTATNGALIMALSPLVSALLAALAFRERLTLQRMCGVALGFAGVAAVVLSHPGAGLSSAGTGDLMLVAAVVSFAAGGAIIQKLTRQLHPLSISWAIYLIGTAMLVGHAVIGVSRGPFLSPAPDSRILQSGRAGSEKASAAARRPKLRMSPVTVSGCSSGSARDAPGTTASWPSGRASCSETVWAT